jgi:hypothetical protein
MKLTDLKPNTVYGLTYSDSRAASNYGASVYATTGPEVTIVKGQPGPHSWSKGSPTRVYLYPIPDAPPRIVEGGPGNELGSISKPTLRRGLSILGPVCTVDEWPAYRAEKLAERAKREAEATARVAAIHAQEARMGDALRALEIDPDGPIGGHLMSVARRSPNQADATKVLAIMEAAAAEARAGRLVDVMGEA